MLSSGFPGLKINLNDDKPAFLCWLIPFKFISLIVYQHPAANERKDLDFVMISIRILGEDEGKF